ncbi:MAG TPA: response regulator [Thermoanaerobaculia bacterium]
MTSKPATILIVDDDEATLTSLGGFLELEGYGVETAVNGREALEKLKRIDPPALILLDLKMPVMDGWEFLSERSRDRASRHVPIVLLSGLSFIPDAPGVADFLSKPIHPPRLLECVRRFCGNPSPDGRDVRAARPTTRT